MQSPALPNGWIDRLFQRFSVMYGKHWHEMWADVPMADVKDGWAENLAPFDGDQIRLALEHCARELKFPPTMPEFVALCRQFRTAVVTPALPAPRAEMPAEIGGQLSEFVSKFGRRTDPHGWAKAILKEADEGTYRWAPGIESAKRVLGVTQ